MWKWLLALATLTLIRGSAFAQLPQQPLTVATRFGALSVGPDRVLLFKGRPVQPRVEGNNRLDLGEPYRVGAADVVLVTNEGGTACPYLYRFVTITRSGAKPTPAYGTCAALNRIERAGDTLRVYMDGFRGPFEPVQEQRAAAMERHVFVYRAGVVTENGRPVR
jgi:hypothetical protein